VILLAKRKSPKVSRKKTSKKKKKNDIKKWIEWILLLLPVAIIVFVVLTSFIKKYDNGFNNENIEILDENSIIAYVNNEQISLGELDKLYDASVPENYKQFFSREQFLIISLIPQRLLLQEAEIAGIEVTDEEVDEILENVLKDNGLTIEQLNDELANNGDDLEGLMSSYGQRIKLLKFLNENLFKNVKATQKEIRELYNSLNLSQSEISFESVKDSLKERIVVEKQDKILEEYLFSLKENSNIEILFNNQPESFIETGDEICKEEGKPVLRLYTANACEQCSEVGFIFNQLASAYVNAGVVKAYHWEIDTGDNLLTAEKEKGIPSSEWRLLKQYNPDQTVPTYIMGCSFLRIGNLNSDTMDQIAEENELSNAILAILS